MWSNRCGQLDAEQAGSLHPKRKGDDPVRRAQHDRWGWGHQAWLVLGSSPSPIPPHSPELAAAFPGAIWYRGKHSHFKFRLDLGLNPVSAAP